MRVLDASYAGLLLVGAVVLLGLVGLFVRAYQARGRVELRCQILDALALATRRGLPLAALLARIGEELAGARKAELLAVARDLERGERLSAALARCAPAIFPLHVTESLRAVEGTAALPGLLGALATGATRTQSAHHRVLLALAYPALLGGVFLALPWNLLTSFRIHLLLSEENGLNQVARALAWAVWGALIAGLLIYLTPHRWHWLGAFCSRLVHAERILRALAAQVAAGEPLPVALRQAGLAAGHGGRLAAARAAAESMEGGAAPGAAWELTGLPAFVTTRAAAASGSAPAAFARVLESLAEECAARFESRLERALRWAQPLAIAFFGAVIALHFREFFQILDRVRVESALW